MCNRLEKLNKKSQTSFSKYGEIERFSFECRKTKTKVITLTNHNSRKQPYETIRARSEYMSHVWFWFYF